MLRSYWTGAEFVIETGIYYLICVGWLPEKLVKLVGTSQISSNAFQKQVEDFLLNSSRTRIIFCNLKRTWFKSDRIWTQRISVKFTVVEFGFLTTFHLSWRVKFVISYLANSYSRKNKTSKNEMQLITITTRWTFLEVKL